MRWDFLLLIIGHLFVHGVILMSIFDAHFTSSVVQDIEPLEWCSDPTSHRIVLFVADGLRADKFFELDKKNETTAPFLRSIMEQNGTWGVSHTKAPTESRPAHVAMLGGFWEDPNALKVGWKYNPVEFDTVLNESRETWAWGANDVLPYFNKGTAASHVHLQTHHYQEYHLSKLDVWVFDRVKSFLSNAKTDSNLQDRLSKDKIVFFLHLAGIDSNGHRFHPGSSYYRQNIRVVDDGIREIADAFKDFYNNDGKTAFIFTGDHGMTDGGGHGGDHPTEVQTPFVAWGSGINHKLSSHHDAMTLSHSGVEKRKWGLDHSTRMDISQVDISMLMASLIGVPYPVNSIGRIPMEYLIDDEATKTEQIHGRTKQMVETFLKKRSIVEEKEFHLIFWEFRKNEKDLIKHQKDYINTLIQMKQFVSAMKTSLKLFEFASHGFQYYQNYHSFSIFTCVLLSVSGWIVLCFTFALKETGTIRESGSLKSLKHFQFLLLLLYVAVALRIYQFGGAWRYHLYTLLPIIVWFSVLIQRCNIITVCKLLGQKHGLKMLLTFAICAVWLYIICMGFYDRRVFSICFALLTVLSFLKTLKSRKLTGCKVVWTTLCVCFMVFPMLPEVVKQDTRKEMVLFGGILASVFCACAKIYHKRQPGQNPKRLRIFELTSVISVFFPALTGLIGFSNSYSAIQSGKTIVTLSLIAPFFSSSNLFERLVNLHVWQLSAYILVSVSYDVFFYVILTALLHVWVVMESQAHSTEVKAPLLTFEKGRGISVQAKPVENLFHDVRLASIMVFILVIGFFGIFSVESMNHFHVRVLPFLPVTNTFALIFLFVYKLCLHYLAIGAAFCTLSELMQFPLKVSWCLVVCLCDFMLMHFYFAVRNSGSWAQIGFSIANLGIVAGLPVGLLLIVNIGKLMMFTPVPEILHIF